MAHCLNCSHPVADRYCPRCGQKTSVARYSVKTFLADLKETFLHLDSNILRTCMALTRRPGPFIRDYLFGKRVRHVSPFKYLFVIVALNVALSFILARPAINPVSIETGGQGVPGHLISLLTSLVFIVLMVPFALAMRLIGRDTGHRFMEHVSFLLYILSQSVLLFIVLQLILGAAADPLDGPIEGAVWFILFTAFFVRSYPGYVNDSGKRNTEKIVLIYGTALALIAVLMWLAGILVNRFFV